MNVGKGLEQPWQVFQYGNVYFVFPCGLFGVLEGVAVPVSDKAAVISADELIGSV